MDKSYFRQFIHNGQRPEELLKITQISTIIIGMESIHLKIEQQVE